MVSVLEGGYDLEALARLGRRPCHRADAGMNARTHAAVGTGAANPVRYDRMPSPSATLSQIGNRPWPKQQHRTSTTSALPFERAIEELESIVKRLEEGKVPLEESVAIYERGEALKRRCEELLRQAEARVEKITLDAAGKPTGTEPLDVE